MEVLDFPDELILEVFQYLPEFVLYPLLSSTTCAKYAYAVYYKYVYLTDDKTFTRPEMLASRYLNSYNSKVEGPIFKNLVKEESPLFDANPTFDTPRRLLYFYRCHPLFIPHTLACNDIKHLVDLKEMKPGFLKRFKNLICFEKEHYSWVVDSKTLRSVFSNFVTTKLSLFTGPQDVMPTVKALKVGSGEQITNHLLSKVPNAEEIIGCLPEGVCFDRARLRSITITFSEGDIDFSSLHSLKELCLSLKKGDTVGFDSSCSHRITMKLTRLCLTEVSDHRQVDIRATTYLKSLEIEASYEARRLMGGLKLPCGLRELVYGCRGWCSCRGLSLPQGIERVRLYSFNIVTFRSLPTSLRELDLGTCFAHKLPRLKELKFLKTLVLYDGPLFLAVQDLPWNLLSVELDSMSGLSLPKVRYLKYLTYSPPKKKVVVGKSLSHFTLNKVVIQTLRGCENLVALELIRCRCLETMSRWKFNRLEALTIVSHRTLVNSFPSSPCLRYLSLKGTNIKGRLVCPQSLEYLSIVSCSFRAESSPRRPVIQLNDMLEVVFLDNTSKCKYVFNDPGPCLKSISLRNLGIDTFAADFTTSSLEEFLVMHCSINFQTVKFPKVFKHLSVIGNRCKKRSHTGEPQGSWDWVDLSKCEQFCSFENTEPQNKHDDRSLMKLKTQIARIQDNPSF